MEIIKTINFKFSEKEKEILDKTLEIVREFKDSDACDSIDLYDCEDCPFGSLCNYSTAEAVERKINNLLSK